MPYIAQESRDRLNPHLDALANELRGLECDNPDNVHAGNLNYIFTTLLARFYGNRYSEINEAVGVLECTKHEFYRRVASPYEDRKSAENGDVFNHR